ncbi:hypothetical protein MRX96_052072 [Rhipicephalus microplus]
MRSCKHRLSLHIRSSRRCSAIRRGRHNDTMILLFFQCLFFFFFLRVERDGGGSSKAVRDTVKAPRRMEMGALRFSSSLITSPHHAGETASLLPARWQQVVQSRLNVFVCTRASPNAGLAGLPFRFVVFSPPQHTATCSGPPRGPQKSQPATAALRAAWFPPSTRPGGAPPVHTWAGCDPGLRGAQCSSLSARLRARHTAAAVLLSSLVLASYVTGAFVLSTAALGKVL